MTVKLASLKTNAVVETDGAWISIPELAGVKLRVRSFSYGPYRTERALVIQKLQRKFKTEVGAAREDATFKEFGALFAKHILLDWCGFDTGYTPELAAELLPSQEWKFLHAAVEYAAGQVEKIEAEYVEDAEKN